MCIYDYRLAEECYFFIFIEKQPGKCVKCTSRFLFKLVIFDDIWIQCQFSMFLRNGSKSDGGQRKSIFCANGLCDVKCFWCSYSLPYTMNDLYRLQSENKGSDFTGLEIRRILLYLKLQTRHNFSEIDGLIYQSNWEWHLHFLTSMCLMKAFTIPILWICQCSTMKTCSYNLQICQFNSSPNLEDFTMCHILF